MSRLRYFYRYLNTRFRNSSRLFWKLFLSSMLALIGVSYVSYGLTAYVLKESSFKAVIQQIDELMVFKEQLVEPLQADDIDAVITNLLDNSQYASQILVFDEYGNEVLGRSFLPESQVWSEEVIQQWGDLRYVEDELVETIYSWRDQMYTIEIYPQLTTYWWISQKRLGVLFRSVLLVISSAIICYFLIRPISKRIAQLRYLSKRIASGELNVSIIPSTTKQRDEISDLMHDFQNMVHKLSESSQARQRMLSDISHELRSPLARIQVALEVARVSPARHAEMLDRVEQESVRMDGMIEKIIIIQKLQSATQTIDLQAVDLTQLLGEIVADARFEYQQQHKSIGLKSPEQAHCTADRRLLKSALENIIRNALFYTHNDTEVLVKLQAHNDSMLIEISDAGDGIPDAFLSDIFEPFRRLDESRTRSCHSGGFGLGLSIAASVINAHQGQISAHPNLPHGLTIKIILPITLQNG